MKLCAGGFSLKVTHNVPTSSGTRDAPVGLNSETGFTLFMLLSGYGRSPGPDLAQTRSPSER
jgi:hypothetical protein